MGIFMIDRIESLCKNYKKKFNTIIETGTLFGEGTNYLSNFFSNVHTIEIQKELYTNAMNRFSKNPSITCHLGDSPFVIKELSKKLYPKDGIVFYLDAHWSGDHSVDWKNSKWKGYDIDTGCRNNDPKDPVNQNPLLEELKIIIDNFPQQLIIYIDDMDKFNYQTGESIVDCCFNGENWTHINIQKIFDIVQARIIDTNIYEDQILFLIKEKL
jgi:hypothetical protein